MLVQITPVLLTYKEEENISRTLSHLACAKDIVVLTAAARFFRAEGRCRYSPLRA
jgi:hypothetical protein